MTVTKLEELVETKGEDYDGYTRKVKYAALDEAVEFMEGKIAAEDLRSNLQDHKIPAHLMSGIYLSHGRWRRGLDPTVSLDLSFENGKHTLAFG